MNSQEPGVVVETSHRFACRRARFLEEAGTRFARRHGRRMSLAKADADAERPDRALTVGCQTSKGSQACGDRRTPKCVCADRARRRTGIKIIGIDGGGRRLSDDDVQPARVRCASCSRIRRRSVTRRRGVRGSRQDETRDRRRTPTKERSRGRWVQLGQGVRMIREDA